VIKLDCDALKDQGWTIDTRKGVVLRGYASVSLCLMIEERLHICIPGSGCTYDEAVLDAVAAVNTWLWQQRPPIPFGAGSSRNEHGEEQICRGSA
jgi:hypothetical protein